MGGNQVGPSGGSCEVAGRLKAWVQQYKVEHGGRKPQKHQLPADIRASEALHQAAL